MARTFAGWGLALVVALALGVAGAGGHTLATSTTVRVEVQGVGEIKDDKNQMDCGNGHTQCRVSYTGSGSVTFTVADEPAGWEFSDWSGDCSADPCTVTLDLSDEDHEIVAEFDSTGALPGTSTLTVTNTGDANDDGGMSRARTSTAPRATRAARPTSTPARR